ncbi:MAG: hypothetical protein M1352_02240 [Patescibacteria group bacterium]|nr:hypothetical protein [Patescibacteria group bacterium]
MRIDILGNRRFGVAGVTLIELMITIAGIAVLASILVTVINPVSYQQKARDSVRLRDLNTLKSVIILALQNGGTFTGRCTAASPCNSLAGGLNVDGSGYVDLPLPGYLTQLPADPLSSHNTFVDGTGATVPSAYLFAESGSDFEIKAHFESSSNTDRYSSDGGTDNTSYEVGTKLNIF